MDAAQKLDNSRNMIRLLLILVWCFMLLCPVSSLYGQINDANSLNDHKRDNYSFIVGGHYYGNSSNKTGIPANTIVANLGVFNDSEIDFQMVVGDVFLDIKEDYKSYTETFFSRLQKPLFIAVGNHDVSGKFFEDNLGPTCFSFNYGGDVHIVLDTEKDDGSIIDEQLTVLRKGCSSEANNIFIYSHRPIWFEENPEMKDIFKNNSRSKFGVNYQSEVEPILKLIPKNRNVYWFSGSLGGSAPASFFYHSEDNIHFIQTAIRGLKRDAVLKVSSIKGKIKFSTISLTDEDLDELESFNLEFWRSAHPKEDFNPRLIKMYVLNAVFHRFFWYGFVSAMVIVLAFLYWKRRKRNYKKLNG